MLAEEMQAVSKGLEKVEHEFKASESDGPVSEIFREVKHCLIWISGFKVVCILYRKYPTSEYNLSFGLNRQPSFGENYIIMQRLVHICLEKIF